MRVALKFCVAALFVALASGGVWAQTAELQSFRDCAACPDMVEIPAGSFEMGSHNRDDFEAPVRTVRVARFAIGAYEATFEQWAACVADGFCQSRPAPRDDGWGRGDRPVISITWEDVTGAGGFIDWVNSKVVGAPYRLPSEAEWEYAARAGDRSSTGFDADPSMLGQFGWHKENSGGRTHPVGAKPPNAFGLYDMHGNVNEWMQDCWSPSHSGAPTDGSARTDGDCYRRVLRSGAWDAEPQEIRAAARYRFPSDGRYNSIGFRVARSLAE